MKQSKSASLKSATSPKDIVALIEKEFFRDGQLIKIKVDFVALYFRDWLPDLLVMSPEMGGAYVRLCFKMYEEGGALPNDLATPLQTSGLSEIEFNKVWASLKRKFVVVNGFLFHKRCVLELLKAHRILQSQRRAGLKSAALRERRSNDPSTPLERRSNDPSTSRKRVRSKVTTKEKSKEKKEEFQQRQLLFTAVATETDLCRKRFAELFPTAISREQNTINKLIRNCSHLAQTNSQHRDALKVLLSIIRRCSEGKKPLAWIVGAANKEGIGFDSGSYERGSDNEG